MRKTEDIIYEDHKTRVRIRNEQIHNLTQELRQTPLGHQKRHDLRQRIAIFRKDRQGLVRKIYEIDKENFLEAVEYYRS